MRSRRPAISRIGGGRSGSRGGKSAFEALPEPDRKATQDSLVWTGDYSGIVDGGFGRQTFAAITSFQRRTKRAPNGILDDGARADLRMAAQQSREAAGFAPVDDPLSGARIGVPARLLTRREANPNGGSRWQSADGKVTLDTQGLPAPGGRPSGPLRPQPGDPDAGTARDVQGGAIDFFVIAGETPTGRFYTRYASSGTTIRGFSIGYGQEPREGGRPVGRGDRQQLPAVPAGAPAPARSLRQAGCRSRRRNASSGQVSPSLRGRSQLTTASVSACGGLRAAGAKPHRSGRSKA